MPIVDYSLEIIRDNLRDLASREDCKYRVLCFSVPDVIVSDEKLIAMFGEEALRDIARRPDSDQSINWHKSHLITRGPLVDTAALFDAVFGYQMDAMDIVTGRGNEIIQDLSLPVDPRFHGRYDFVFDIVSNQCFDVYQAMKNAANVCRVGGRVMHVIPVCMPNQGFWSVSPTAYKDFYETNGFRLLMNKVFDGVYEKRAEIWPHPYHRMRDLPDDAMNVVVAEKLEHRPLVPPIMTKFKIHPKAQIEDPNQLR